MLDIYIIVLRKYLNTDLLKLLLLVPDFCLIHQMSNAVHSDTSKLGDESVNPITIEAYKSNDKL